jgi:LysR family transcriptional regulator, low CO2-responsive transcriptional regulator
MKNVTLRQLKVFEAVARHLSFTRAAEELHLTQPAVSAQVKELESHAGLALFERIGRRTYLTEAGTTLLGYARAILTQLRDAEEALARQKGVAGGRLNVAVISAGDYFFPRLLALFVARHPGVTLNLTVHNREELLHRLAENMTDLAVMVRPPQDADVVAEAFAPHAYVLVAPRGHALAGRRRVPLADVLRQPFVLRERGSDTWMAMAEAFGERMRDVRVAMEIRSNETIKQAVIAGMGLAFMSEHAIVQDVALGNLVVLDVAGFPARRHWFVVHRSTKRLPPVAQAFKAFLQAEGARWLAQTMRHDRRTPAGPGKAVHAAKQR